MAVLALKSIQLTEGARNYPVSDHGKLRFDYFEIVPVAVAGDANTTIDLCNLPPGRVRILPGLSRLNASAFGAGRTLDLGHRAYAKADYANGGADEPEDAAAFIDGRDVSAATDAAFSTTVVKFDVFSKAGVTLFATALGGPIPVGATVQGLVAYIHE